MHVLLLIDYVLLRLRSTMDFYRSMAVMVTGIFNGWNISSGSRTRPCGFCFFICFIVCGSINLGSIWHSHIGLRGVNFHKRRRCELLRRFICQGNVIDFDLVDVWWPVVMVVEERLGNSAHLAVDIKQHLENQELFLDNFLPVSWSFWYRVVKVWTGASEEHYTEMEPAGCGAQKLFVSVRLVAVAAFYLYRIDWTCEMVRSMTWKCKIHTSPEAISVTSRRHHRTHNPTTL